MTARNLIGSISEKINASNYDLSHLKVQFIVNEGDMLDHLTVSMPAPAKKDEEGMDIIAVE